VDDSDDGTVSAAEETLLDDVMLDATDQANEVLLQFYEADVLETSLWVRRRVSVLACHLLSRRRGNASQFEDEAARFQDFLEDLRNHRRFIPRMQTKANFSPAVSNYRVENRYCDKKLRVIESISPSGDKPDRDSSTGCNLDY